MYIPYTGTVPRDRVATSPDESKGPKRKVLRMSNKPNVKSLKKKDEVPHVHTECCALVNCPIQPDKHDKHEANKKQSLLSRLFRSISDPQGLKQASKAERSPKASPRPTPRSSPGAPPHRRFMRVVRDDQAVGEEYVNPHVKRRYTAGYWERSQDRLTKSASLPDEHPRRRSGSCSPPNVGPLPYTVSGHTILKKVWSSVDDSDVTFSCSPKRATFAEEVEVVEFDIQQNCALISQNCVSRERLHDDSDHTDSVSEHACMQAQEDHYDSALISAHSKHTNHASDDCASPTFKSCVLAELNGETQQGCRELLESADASINHALYSLDVISESSSDEEDSATLSESSLPAPEQVVPV